MRKAMELRRLPSMTLLPVLFLWTLILLSAFSPASSTGNTGEDFIRAFTGMMQSPHRDTRLQAYFRSAGLPEKAEYVRTLRRSLSGADALERLAVLYALAVMTRAPEDVDAFLDAFPTEPWLFHNFFAAEWDLSGTLNQGVANFLLILVYEQRTRDRALSCLARLTYTNVASPSEFLSRYSEDPIVAEYVEEHREILYVAYPDSPIEKYIPLIPWSDFLAPLMHCYYLETLFEKHSTALSQLSYWYPNFG